MNKEIYRIKIPLNIHFRALEKILAQTKKYGVNITFEGLDECVNSMSFNYISSKSDVYVRNICVQDVSTSEEFTFARRNSSLNSETAASEIAFCVGSGTYEKMYEEYSHIPFFVEDNNDNKLTIADLNTFQKFGMTESAIILSVKLGSDQALQYCLKQLSKRHKREITIALAENIGTFQEACRENQEIAKNAVDVLCTFISGRIESIKEYKDYYSLLEPVIYAVESLGYVTNQMLTSCVQRYLIKLISDISEEKSIDTKLKCHLVWAALVSMREINSSSCSEQSVGLLGEDIKEIRYSVRLIIDSYERECSEREHSKSIQKVLDEVLPMPQIQGMHELSKKTNINITH